MFVKWILPLLLLSVVASLADAAASSSTVRSVCEVARSPLAFEGRKIAISANLIHNGVDVLYFSDDNCPDLAIDFRFASNKRQSPKLIRLIEALSSSGMRGNPFLAISGTFVGVVRMSPQDSYPPLMLMVEHVESLTVSPVEE